MNVWLVAASGPEAQRHLRDTVENPIPVDVVRQYFRPEEWARTEPIFLSQPGIYAWGATEGRQNVRRWNEMSPGDICLFYLRGEFVYYAKIVYKSVNEDLARQLWGTNDNGQTWKYLYFLSEPRRIRLPLEEFNHSHGYNMKSVLGLTKVRSAAVKDIELKYGSYEKYLTTDLTQYNREPRSNLADVCDIFASALQESGLHFGSRHLHLVRSFISSLATKGFVILTGLTGSGKTQIALRFGDWIGGARHSLTVAVRPDWTSPEALLGYEDALLKPAPDGRRAWHVPPALEFMLQAAADPSRPYLLILDEMNLAHVERYFADILSGMESGRPCLPNLQREGGYWYPPVRGESRIPVPRNLFVVGTVNVDETTYMFSPKVLDRANTIEFRVSADELRHDARRPKPCRPAEPPVVEALLAVATDPDWHVEHPAPYLDEFTEHLRAIHRLLSPWGLEFGHRTYTEAVRFACILYACGEEDMLTALDLQVMQKILPRFHGSRRRLEEPLLHLGCFCYNPHGFSHKVPANTLDPEDVDAQQAKLPLSFAKIQRMLRILRANQFVSFAE